MKGRIMKKISALFLTLVMMSGLIVVYGTADAYAAGGTYKLPTSVTQYKYENGKWKKQHKVIYKYDKRGNLIRWDGAHLKNTYKNGKLTNVVATGINKDMFGGIEYYTAKTYNSKGKITRLDYDDGEVNIGFRYYYNGKGYINKRANVYNKDYITTYAFKYYKSGMPKKITEHDEKKTIEEYNDQGLPVSGKRYEGKKLETAWTNKITTSKGNVTKVIETHKSGKKITKKYKYVYTYGSAKTKDIKQYAAIMCMTQGSLLFRTIGNNSAIGWCYYTYDI